MHWYKVMAVFKIIVVGSQVLNPMSTDEGLYNYSYEYHQAHGFFKQDKNKRRFIFNR